MRAEEVGVFEGLLGRQRPLSNHLASIRAYLSALHTLSLSAGIGTRLLPLSHIFGIVVCFEGGLCFHRLFTDDVAIWVAEDLRTYCVEEYPK